MIQKTNLSEEVDLKPDIYKSRCPKCKGEGFIVLVPKPDYEWKTGAAGSFTVHKKECPDCLGNGWIENIFIDQRGDFK